MRAESLSDYLGVLRRRLFIILLVAALIAGAFVGVGLRLPYTFSSSVLIDVESESSSTLSAVTSVLPISLGGGGGADPIAMQTLTSRIQALPLLEKARRSYSDIEPSGSKLLPPVTILAKSIHPAVEPGSNMIRIRFDLREFEGGARNAALFVNHLTETLRGELAGEQFDDGTQETSLQLRLVEKQREDLEARLDETRSALLAFAREAGSPTVWSVELTQLFNRYESLATNRETAASRVRLSAISQAHTSGRLANEDAMTVASKQESEPAMRGTILSMLVASNVENARKVGESASETTPERKGLDAERHYLETELQKLPEREIRETLGLNPRYTQLLQQLDASEIAAEQAAQEVGILDSLISGVREEISLRAKEIPERQIRLEILQREAETLATLYDDLLLQQARLKLALGQAEAKQDLTRRRVGGIAVIDPARPEFRPVRPRVNYLIGVGAVLGLFAGVAVGILFEWLNGESVSVMREQKTLDRRET